MATSIRDRLVKLLEMDVADIASLPAMYRHLTHVLRFSIRVVERFIDDKCIQRASALAYASLLAIVPLVALGFSIFASFQAFDVVAGHVRDTLLEYLVPASREAVESYLGSVAGKSTALSIFGIIGLLFTSTALLNTIEEAFNDIWRISRARPWFSKFMTFWATLTLSPILIGASITITSYFAALPALQHVAEGASYIGRTPFLLPWLMSSLALAAMYAVLPNTSVPFRYAMVGGLVAGALFEWAKMGFAFYVTHVASYEKLYGALSTLPVFLIWLYLVWVIVLLGSEVSFCMQHPEQSHRKQSAFLRAGIQQFFSHLILLRAAQALEKGRMLAMAPLIEETHIPGNILQEWLDELSDKGLLRRADSGGGEVTWLPGRDADGLNLNDIFLKLNGNTMYIPDEWRDTPIGRTLTGLYYRRTREQEDVFGQISIRDLMLKEEQASPVESVPAESNPATE
ncbi:MAG TPA: YihY family inner membrane protein [Mariprofundaceae bacterium]|nr:YihY family inner membrane protein [Mariprofundaceae bacterium]